MKYRPAAGTAAGDEKKESPETAIPFLNG